MRGSGVPLLRAIDTWACPNCDYAADNWSAVIR